MPKEEEHYLNPNPPFQDDQTPTKPHHPIPTTTSSKCLVHTLLLVVLLSIATLILATIFLKIQPPTLRISKITVSENATALLADVTLHNNNFGRFQFHGGNATLLHGNASIGAGSIAGSGLIGRRDRTGFNVMVRVSSDRHQLLLPANYNSSDGLNHGSVIDLRVYGELRGQVRVVKIVRKRTTAVMNCTMGFNLTSQLIRDLSCQ